MLTLRLSLDFACAACGRPVGVTLKCEGDGLKALHPVATVKVPCPSCGAVNQLVFGTNGTVHRVSLERPAARLTQPCPN